jgi:hypothetical protein
MTIAVFPLDSSVWGNVADWFMVIATAITGYLIFNTLKSQLAVQRMQQAILKVTEVQHLRAIMPYFSIDKSVGAKFGSLENTCFVLSQGPALNTNVFFNEKRCDAGIEPASQKMADGDLFLIALGSKHYDELEYKDGRVFSLRFDDAYGNTWEQTVVPDDPSHIFLSHPKRIRISPTEL